MKKCGHLEDLVVDRSIILKWILKEWARGCGPDSSGLEQGRVAGLHDHESEYWLSIKCGELSA
jgi:hypothetical protein